MVGEVPQKNQTIRKILPYLIGAVAVYIVMSILESFQGVGLRSFNTSSGISNPQFAALESGFSGVKLSASDTSYEAPSVSESTTRMVIQSSNLSLLVKDVKESGDKILSFAKEKGGYMVNTSYNRPTDSPFATITVRVPSEKFEEALEYFRSLAMKVTNENIQGRDVTDQYEDIEERLATLNKTKTRLEAIMDMTNDVSEIIRVQKEIINIQSQIDSAVGRKQALEQEVAMTKITAYLSTDELSLPYTPDEKFRPNVVFKLAVRSLLGTLKSFGEKLIWIAVYSIIWIPAIVIYKLVKRWRARKGNLKPQ